MVESDIPVLRVLRERLAASRDDEGAYRRGILSAVGDTMGWSVGALWLPDAAGTRLVLAAEWRSRWHPGTAFLEASRDWSFAPGEGMPGRVWASGAPSWIADVTAEPTFCRLEPARTDGLRTGIGIPMTAVDGHAVGVLEFFTDRVRDSLPLLVDVLRAIGLTAAPAFAREAPPRA